MKNRKVKCVEISGVFYESLSCAGKTIGCSHHTIKDRCLSDKFPNYKIVPFRITYTKKRCSKCGESKLLKEFSKDINNMNGLNSQCKQCDSGYSKQYYQDNIEQCKRKSKEWTEENPGYKKEWEAANPGYREKYREEWYNTNPDYDKNRRSQQCFKDKKNKQARDRKKTDPTFKLNENIRVYINKSLKKGGKNGMSLKAILGYTIKELITHLESKFTEGMTWENYGGGKYEWSLDHIIAVSKWDITSAECQALKDCWALDNLQPLWHVRNMEKGNKPMEPKYLIKPF